jgi:hypothetical protein
MDSQGPASERMVRSVGIVSSCDDGPDISSRHGIPDPWQLPRSRAKAQRLGCRSHRSTRMNIKCLDNAKTMT